MDSTKISLLLYLVAFKSSCQLIYQQWLHLIHLPNWMILLLVLRGSKLKLDWKAIRVDNQIYLIYPADRFQKNILDAIPKLWFLFFISLSPVTSAPNLSFYLEDFRQFFAANHIGTLAAMSENIHLSMCVQRRFRSACTFMQSES